MTTPIIAILRGLTRPRPAIARALIGPASPDRGAAESPDPLDSIR